jgi:hypothetical protein
VFCFQEVYATSSTTRVLDGAVTDLLDRLADALPDYEMAYTPILFNALDQFRPVDFPLTEGIATFTRRSLRIVDQGVVPIGREVYTADGREIELLRSFQHTTISQDGRRLCVLNVHGTVHPGSKLDTAKRLAQSHTILGLLRDVKDDIVICGDLNLMPDTESVRLLEADHRNLIREYGITNTRSRLNPYFGTSQAQGFADYAFVSPGLIVRDFQVPYLEVSDHLPLILDLDWQTAP